MCVPGIIYVTIEAVYIGREAGIGDTRIIDERRWVRECATFSLGGKCRCCVLARTGRSVEYDSTTSGYPDSREGALSR